MSVVIGGHGGVSSMVARVRDAVVFGWEMMVDEYRSLVDALPPSLARTLRITINAVLAATKVRIGDALLSSLMLLFSGKARAKGLVKGVLLPPIASYESAMLGSFVFSYTLAYDLTVENLYPAYVASREATPQPRRMLSPRWIGGIGAALATLGHGYALARPSAGVFLGVRAVAALGKAKLAAAGVTLAPWVSYAAFALVNGPIMYAAFLEPALLERSYYSWMLRVSAMSHRELETVVRARRRAVAEGADPSALPLVDCVNGYHAGPSCAGAITVDWVAGIGRALWVYVPVHLLPVLLYKRRALTSGDPQRTMRTLVSLGKNIAGSAAFLSTYQAIFKACVCAGRRILGYDSGLVSLFGGMATAVSLLWEKPKRVSELTLYCAYKSVLVVWAWAVSRSLAIPIPGAERAILSLAILTLVTRPDNELPPFLTSIRSSLLLSERELPPAYDDPPPAYHTLPPSPAGQSEGDQLWFEPQALGTA
ncbi:uncharacterized protein AMSG_02966 [Thecamonas trahens ATCC 50062]|uniref:Transmembrane protein n=1 Tax=Thecamonas trahens ATCC 50062 TaxID=461836 RepID=A0A0L0D2X6_THETB|nr:transmembrane protein [Thecamonas trahens ATCC 50062]KNC46530.1 transmembrane protein [Thecamonas trahens ATCC 50062]|eukprot:XP_013760311.1 transmembrane protein [Thecamonas trahens ATCC 50062]